LRLPCANKTPFTGNKKGKGEIVQEQFSFNLGLSLSFPSKETASIVLRAVEPEIKARKHSRSNTVVSLNGKKIFLRISAVDPVAMRASFNSAMKAIVFSHKLLKNFQ